ncbi:nucleoside hydrolase [uncultured Amnibacterium sp.]|uniref:nucleoside hydrolase n=1 Tax=uncultured Amnibacterium sp. TaxID=1631851 RepID=UPI0035CB8193
MTTPRVRVIIDNDFSGDPDDLFQLVHHLLSPSVTVPFVIGSHLAPQDPFDDSDRQADNAARIAEQVLDLLDLGGSVPVHAGSNTGLASPTEPIDGPAARAIIAEALRDDPDPLYIALGGGLTDLASALLIEPRIADRFTAIWIGGGEHDGLGSPPPDADPIEYNLAIDVAAATAVFDHSWVEIWQVPRNVYRQCLVSRVELERRVRPRGPVGAYLVEAIDRAVAAIESAGAPMGETYALGDSPLVLLTALQSPFQPDPSSSEHVVLPTPRITADGRYRPNPNGRPMRVYTRVDTRLMFEDLFLKLEVAAEGGRVA